MDGSVVYVIVAFPSRTRLLFDRASLIVHPKDLLLQPTNRAQTLCIALVGLAIMCINFSDISDENLVIMTAKLFACFGSPTHWLYSGDQAPSFKKTFLEHEISTAHKN